MPNSKTFWFITVLLFLVAVALRWIRLDLMTFRFDQAAVAFRAMETFHSGLPLTGIINSLGFRNGPGYVWTLLPAFLISPDPRLATALHGLLTATMVFPLALLGRHYRRDALKWLPAIVAAVVPASVFAGRNLWAQYLLPSITAWALLTLDITLDPRRSERTRMIGAATALGLMTWGTSIHFSAAALLIITAGLLLVNFRQQLRSLAIAAIPAALVCSTMVPSALDWWDQKMYPRQKPDYAEEFEAILPEALLWWTRIPDSVGYSFNNSSIEAVWGIQTYISKAAVALISAFDVFVFLLIVAGAVFALFRLLRKSIEREIDHEKRLATLLLAWILIPAVAGGLAVERVNAGYFLGSLPAAWLLVLLLPDVSRRFHQFANAVVLAVASSGIAICIVFLAAIHRNGFVPGSYYIPYVRQVEVVRYLVSNGIPPTRVIHLSGDWFRHSYEYIHRHVLTPEGTTLSTPTHKFALLEDSKVRPDQPQHLRAFWALDPVEFGNVGVKLMPSRGAAETFKWKYYEIR